MTPSHPSARGQVQPVLAVVLGAVAVVGIAVAIAVSRPAAPSGPAATDRLSAAPGSTPSVSPSAAPSGAPSVGPSSAPTGPSKVVLRNATGHDVTALVDDQSDSLVAAVSGNPGDGMSIRWHKATIEQGDVDTIVVSWAGLPQDGDVNLNVSATGDGYRLTLVQAGPVPYSDAMGEDRIIVLTFDHAVSAADVDVEILDRTVD